MSESGGGARVAIFLAALGLAVGVTVPKLYKMVCIKGWIPGAVVTREIITQKGKAPARRRRDEDIYWVSWTQNEVCEEDVRRGSGGLIRFIPGWNDPRDTWKRWVRVPPEVWQEMREGDSLEVIHIPGDESSYLRNGVFVEPGNFVIDFLLLTAELIVAIVVLIQLVIHFRRSRTSSGPIKPIGEETVS